MINIIVVTHGEFGAYLVEAAEEIVGPQPDGVRCVGISPRTTLAEARGRVAAAAAELGRADGLVLAVDMPGGTPCNICMPLAKDQPRIAVVSGVNLYMLVTAFNYRRSASLPDLAERMIAAGRKSITDLKAMFLARK